MNKKEALRKIDETSNFYLNTEQKIIAKKIINSVKNENNIDEYIKFIFKYNPLGFKFEPTWEKDTNFVTVAIENKEKSINVNNNISNDENKILIGDCYTSLKNLELTHKEKIKLIFLHLMQLNAKMLSKKEDLFKAGGWLKNIEIKLKIAKELLSKDGFIFIIVNHHEQSYLKILCDQIFGENYFKGSFPIPNTVASIQYDYVLIYSKGAILQKVKSSAKDKYTKNDNDGRGFYHTYSSLLSSASQKYTESTDFPVKIDGKVLYPILNNKRWHWKWNKKRMAIAQKLGLLFATKNQLYYKAYFEYEFTKKTNLLVKKTKQMGISSLKFVNELFENSAHNLSCYFENEIYFNSSIMLIKELIKLDQSEDNLILDIGDKNGLIGVAIASLNYENAAKRSFILNKCDCKSKSKDTIFLIKRWLTAQKQPNLTNGFKLRVFELDKFNVSLTSKNLLDNCIEKFTHNLNLLNRNYNSKERKLYLDLLKLQPFDKK